MFVVSVPNGGSNQQPTCNIEFVNLSMRWQDKGRQFSMEDNFNFQLFIQELRQIIAGVGPQPGYQPKSTPQQKRLVWVRKTRILA